MSERPAPLVDTSVLVRYLTDDPPALGRKAAALVESSPRLVLSELILVETAYVLTSYYEVPREEVVDALSDLVQRRNISLLALPKPLALEALDLCRSSARVSFADAILWAQARHAGAEEILTFDRRFPDEGIALVGSA